MNRNLMMLAAALVLGLGAPGAVGAQDLPTAQAQNPAFAPILPLIGKTWRGRSVGDPPVEDVMRWEWAVGGHAARAMHSVNGGVYAGETMVFPDKDTGQLIFHYFTTGGFHTTGVIRANGQGGLEVDETVHGAETVETLKSTARFDAEGYHTRSLVERDGRMVEFGGFDYREDPTARVYMPDRATGEAAVSAWPMTISRRIVRGVDATGEDVAGYLRVRNGSGAADSLVSASCTCAEKVEFHMIRRGPEGNRMSAEPGLEAPGNGVLDVRPGSDLHLMLIGYDPSKAEGGKVRLTLGFRDAGSVEADFALTEDSAGAWRAFD